MKEPYVEGVANHDGPESCGRTPRGGGRSVDRGTHRQGIEPRNQRIRGADAVNRSGRQHSHHRQREVVGGLARSETPRTCGIFLRENREIRESLTADGAVGRIGKAGGRRR
jgi:hypothetical protein